jgi:uncharacterized protein YraI
LRTGEIRLNLRSGPDRRQAKGIRVRYFLTMLFASLLAAVAATPVSAQKRVALIIGNSNYRHVPSLENPANDARLMADTLRALGFALVGDGAQLDLDKAGIDAAVQRYGADLQGADVGLFYYAGHGVQVRGANYLVPVAANPTREADVDFQMLDVALVLRQMEAAGTRLNLVILDACRNNPFGGRGLRATSSGLAQMRAPEGTLISFATQPGNVALDGSAGNSPYTTALARVIRKPGLGLFDAFNEVGLAVKQATGGAQQPWVSSSPIAGTFHFAAAPPQPPQATPEKPAAPPPAAAPSPPAVTAPPPSPPAVAALPPPATPPAPAVTRTFRVLDNVSQGILNMRAGAGTRHPVVVAIPAGASDLRVGRCRPADDGTGPPWCEVEWRGNSGWVSSCCMAEVAAPTRRTFRILDNVSQGILNVRKGPGARHEVVVAIPKGASDVSVGRCRMPDDGGTIAWCEVEWRGRAGWASACCMVDIKTGAYARAGE